MNKFLFIFLVSTKALAWGPTGHSIVCQIAEHHLTPGTKAAIKAILGSVPFADACTWPDKIRKDPKYEYALTWHYVTINGGETYQSAPKEPRGDVIEVCDRMIKILLSKIAAKEKAQALSFLGHFVGDIHQPLHVGRPNDRGGTQCLLAGAQHAENLHSIWDTKIIEFLNESPSKLVRRLARLSPKEIHQMQLGSFESWAMESVQIRESAVYVAGHGPSNERSPFCAKAGTQPFGPLEQIQLPPNYLHAHTEIVLRRLQQAGIRLAGVLNQVF